MNANANATAQVIQPQLPPLPECVLWLSEEGQWVELKKGTREECESHLRLCDPQETYAIVTVTPPQTPASEAEIYEACGEGRRTRNTEIWLSQKHHLEGTSDVARDR